MMLAISFTITPEMISSVLPWLLLAVPVAALGFFKWSGTKSPVADASLYCMGFLIVYALFSVVQVSPNGNNAFAEFHPYIAIFLVFVSAFVALIVYRNRKNS